MTRAFHWQLLGVVALVAATVAGCGGGPDQPSPTPATTPAPPATSTATATATATASPPPTTTPTTAPSPRATATATPSPTPVPTPVPATATATPSPTPVVPEATAFRYDTYDTTGAVSTPGSYAFLSDLDDTSTAVTTYEALRDGTTTALLIHTSDAAGASRADGYDAVEAGDLFEWRQADDCFIRYTVTEVKPDPTGTVPRKLLAVEWMTYAFTGCSGTISGDLAVTMDFGPLPDLGGTSLSAPVVHGGYQIAPAGWTGEVVPWGGDYSPTYPELTSTTDVAEARKMRHWREPALPAGWTFRAAAEGGYEIQPRDGYSALYVTADGEDGFELRGAYVGAVVSGAKEAAWHSGASLRETRVVAGRPAVVIYSRASRGFPLTLWVYDPATQVQYTIYGYHSSFQGGNVDAVIAIAESLFTPAPPATSATTFRYDTYDTTGAVSTAGSYAFLSDPEDTSTAVTTYEALRDGTTTALLIHTSDADGASRADVYDAVEAGDLFEWRQADDCFVRYTVTEVKPDPTGTVPRKLLAVEWMTYAYSGCSGAVSMDAALSMAWGEMDDLGGEGLVVPVIHGNYQLVPKDWDGDLAESELVLPDHEPDPQYVTTLAEARELEFWREPTIPEGWVLYHAYADDVWTGPYYGYTAIYLTEVREYPDGVSTREPAFEISGYFALQRKAPWDAIWHNGGHVRETRVIAGRPAVIIYSPSGPNHDWVSHIHIHIYDPATQTEYHFIGDDSSLRGANMDEAIAIVRSLFEGTSARATATATPTPTPVAPGATTFLYDTYDTTGAVSTPGSYAFLSDPADTSTVVTTYEALRDGTTTALLIHTSDANGLSRADVYDEVEVGDLFEWRKADDCFVRYRVTDVPEAGPTATHREYGVRWETYVFQGCQTGSVPTSATVTFTAGADPPLEHLGGTSLTDFAVVHGAWEIYPSGTVAHEADVLVPEGTPAHVPDEFAVGDTLTNVTDARKFPYWREPTLPPGWRFHMLVVGGGRDLPPGYEAFFITAAGDHALQIRGEHVVVWPIPWEATWLTNVGERIVRELRTVADRPAVVMYSPDGPQEAELFWARVDIYDAATETVYTVIGSARMGGGPAAIERLLAIVRSLFESPNAP